MINLNQKNQKFLITGGTGFIGSRLVEEILSDGHQVSVLTRKKIKNKKINYIQSLDGEFDYDIVINLCGEAISQRWSKKVKDKIYNSRIGLTNNLVQIINNSSKPPKLFISGSAIGYYGISDNLIFDENSKPTSQNLFSQKICLDWESAAAKISKETRLAIIRTGVVVGKNGGIIKKMLLPFKFGLGGKIGAGNQYLSWIALDDMIGAINHIINNENLSGSINLTAPSVTTNEVFSKTLATKLNRPCFFDMPKFIAKILFGQMGEELLLAGQNVYPKKLLQSNYRFQITSLEEAILNGL
jgi:uncharacterized protein (TIGR01777 family)